MAASHLTSSISSPPGLDGRLGGGMLPSGAACRRGAMAVLWKKRRIELCVSETSRLEPGAKRDQQVWFVLFLFCGLAITYAELETWSCGKTVKQCVEISDYISSRWTVGSFGTVLQLAWYSRLLSSTPQAAYFSSGLFGWSKSIIIRFNETAAATKYLTEPHSVLQFDMNFTRSRDCQPYKFKW